MAFNPFLNTDLRDVLAQGANVGDVRNYGGINYDWTGVKWEPSGGSNGYQSSAFNSGASNNMNWEEILNKTIAMAQKAAEPAVAQLKTSVDPLKAQYEKLLTSIKGEQTTAENRTQQITSRELANRGLLPSSVLAQQELDKAIQPIQSQYQRLYADTGMAQEQDIIGINNAIAQILANASAGGMSAGSGVYSTGTNYNAAMNQLAATKAQNAAENAIKQAELDYKNKYLTDYQIPSLKNKSSNDYDALWKQYNPIG